MKSRPKQKSPAENQKIVDKFNAKYPVGTAVNVTKDDGSIFPTTIKMEADVLGGHTPVGFFHGIAGGYDLTRIKPARL